VIFRNLFDTSGLAQPEGWLMNIFGGGQTYSGELVSEDTALLNSNVYTCVSILGADIGKLPLQIFKRKGGSIQKDSSHSVAKLLSVRANPYMTAYIFKELMEVHKNVWGNAYANIEFGPDGYPKALWPLSPKTDIEVDENGEVWYITPLPNGEFRKLYPNEVLHFKNISKNGLKGISPISVVREKIGIQQASDKFIGAFYANGTSTRGVLKVPTPLEKPAKDRVREEWQKLNTGISNAHRIAILDAGLDYMNIGMPLTDAQFIETQKWGLLEIAKIYKMPPHKLGQTDAKFSNMEQQSIEYVKNTLLPECTNWEQEINFKLFTDKEQSKYYVKFNLNAELRGDSQSRAQYYKEMVGMGAYTINEVRDFEEMDNIGELGDKHFVSLNYVSLEKMDEYQMSKAKGGKGGDDDGQGKTGKGESNPSD
jgi:HK97 family phage portal protein